jgi:A/G-specific adenine glycosylase
LCGEIKIYNLNFLEKYYSGPTQVNLYLMETTDALKKYFTKQLMAWHNTDNDRSLPWKQEKDPYKIWLSEVILQQTRALQGLPYYIKFTAAYPTIADMAAAGDEEVFRIWQGLGYYNRCKNMLVTARLVTQEYGGKFPESYYGLLQLKGIGPYTAAAIASFAFKLPNAVVDGNVYRVLARYFGISEPIDTTKGKKLFHSLAQDLLYTEDSAGYNQAIMDLGATVCTPKSPDCTTCPLNAHCIAQKQLMISMLPVKSKKLKIKERYFHYLLLLCDDKVWISKRGPRDIWENLHEPYLIEHIETLDRKALQQHNEISSLGIDTNLITFEGTLSQRLTHRIIKTSFFTAHIDILIKVPGRKGVWVQKKALKDLAFPKTVIHFLEKNLYF